MDCAVGAFVVVPKLSVGFEGFVLPLGLKLKVNGPAIVASQSKLTSNSHRQSHNCTAQNAIAKSASSRSRQAKVANLPSPYVSFYPLMVI